MSRRHKITPITDGVLKWNGRLHVMPLETLWKSDWPILPPWSHQVDVLDENKGVIHEKWAVHCLGFFLTLHESPYGWGASLRVLIVEASIGRHRVAVEQQTIKREAA